MGRYERAEERAEWITTPLFAYYRAWRNLRECCNSEVAAPVDLLGGGHRLFKSSRDLVEHCKQLPVTVMVRDGWRYVGQETGTPSPREYAIILAPWARIVGELYCGHPDSADLQIRDGEGWITVAVGEDKKAAMRWFAELFNYE